MKFVVAVLSASAIVVAQDCILKQQKIPEGSTIQVSQAGLFCTCMDGVLQNCVSSDGAPAADAAAAAPATGKNCVLQVPQNALSTGLSKPWFVSGCDQITTPTFVECTIVDSATGAFSVYSPLVTDAGGVEGTDFLAPVVPKLSGNAVVGCWIKTNGLTVTLKDTNGSLKAADCVNGVADAGIFGQFAACNAANFFSAVQTVETNGLLKISPLGFSPKTKKQCYTSRSFDVVDQDQSDNVITTYLLSSNKKVIAQKNAANLAKLHEMTGAVPVDLDNADDNLLDGFLDVALECLPFKAPDLVQGGKALVGSLALNEIQASLSQMPPIALVPPQDPMVLDSAGKPNLKKQNAYRVLVNQLPGTGTLTEQTAYCQNLLNNGFSSLITDSPFTMDLPSPDLTKATDLYTFLGQRLQTTWIKLKCPALTGIPSPVTVQRNSHGVAISLTFNTPPLQVLRRQVTDTTEAASTAAMAATSTTIRTADTAPVPSDTGMNCHVLVPRNTFSAEGLATPYFVSGCDQKLVTTFVECTILDTVSGDIFVYSPLVVNAGSVAGVDYIQPVVPELPANPVVGCWFGTNGVKTVLEGKGNTLAEANCVNGSPDVEGDVFGQVADCNAIDFFAAARKALATGLLTIAPVGISPKNHQTCYTTRSFKLVDQDQSDNAVTKYLLSSDGKVIAQDNAANRATLMAMTGAPPTDLLNGSDNLVLSTFVNEALGCVGATAPNLAQGGGANVIGSLALNELQAMISQQPPIALVPSHDPMVLLDNKPNLIKQNAYRAMVNQPPALAENVKTDMLSYCMNLIEIGAPSIVTDSPFYRGFPTPVACMGVDMFTFMGFRMEAAYNLLNCPELMGGVQFPIQAILNEHGVPSRLSFNTPSLQSLALQVFSEGIPNKGMNFVTN